MAAAVGVSGLKVVGGSGVTTRPLANSKFSIPKDALGVNPTHPFCFSGFVDGRAAEPRVVPESRLFSHVLAARITRRRLRG